LELTGRATAWSGAFNLLFIDNPLGVGFSFTHSDKRMATNQQTVGADLYAALLQFFELFPALRKNPFYVTGESYAGKYVPACAYTIHTRNQAAPAARKINLQGIAIGDGAFDPPNQFVGFGQLLFDLGMASRAEERVFEEYESRISAALRKNDTRAAFAAFDEMLNGDIFPFPTYYANVTGLSTNYFNFAQGPGGSSLTKNFFIEWLRRPNVRRAFHVGGVPYAVFNKTVELKLLDDWMVGVIPMLVPILTNYKVLIYSGQNDVILGAPGTERALSAPSLASWPAQAAFKAAPKRVWRRGEDVSGYATVVGNVSYVVVRGAGHMVPADQPDRALDMISRFVNGKPF